VATLIEAIQPDNKLPMTSRVRQAWMALTKEAKEREVIRARGQLNVDLDQLLSQPELDSIEDRFWADTACRGHHM
jgi:hypothetical protein